MAEAVVIFAIGLHVRRQMTPARSASGLPVKATMNSSVHVVQWRNPIPAVLTPGGSGSPHFGGARVTISGPQQLSNIGMRLSWKGRPQRRRMRATARTGPAYLG